MRAEPSVLHLDLDAFYASVEQRDKPSLRGKPVVVGGVGGRGVVATASYEARAFGIHSAMSTAEARRRCPHAAYLSGRFDAYQRTSRTVMTVLAEVSPLVEPLSLDEAYVDLAAAGLPEITVTTVTSLATEIKDRVHEATGGLTASIGIGTSKLIAKIGSDLDKPDGTVVIAPGTEVELLRPMSVGVIPGVGPATRERLRRIGVHTVGDLQGLEEGELVRELGRAHGRGLYLLARAEDDRTISAEREAKSISVEDTYEIDHVDRRLLAALVERQAGRVTDRLTRAGLSGRTVTLKVRLHDFSTHTRSATLPEPTDSPRTIARLARSLLEEVDTSGGVRLLGVGISGLAEWVQDELFGPASAPEDAEPEVDSDVADRAEQASRRSTGWRPGMDVEHTEYGAGWVWGSGHGVVTVRFETAETGPGPVRSFAVSDPALSPRKLG